MLRSNQKTMKSVVENYNLFIILFVHVFIQFFVFTMILVDLSSSLTLEALQPLLTNEEFMSRVRDSLPPNSPESSTTISDQFTSTVQSPQFQQALSTFSTALQSGQLGPLIQQFGLSQDCVDAANSGGSYIL
jgi:hypothetical protein